MEQPGSLWRIAIANRGEAAMRLIRAARDLGAERGFPLETVALVTPPDAGALFAREADIARPLAVPKGMGAAAAYLDADALVEAALAAGADAIWPGWGFLSEDPRLAQATEAAGLRFIGPPPTAMRLAGDKIAAKGLAERCGIPVVPWSGAALDSLDDVAAVANRIGFPLVLKAAAGGGGRGIRLVREASGLAPAFTAATGEALRAFGDGRVFVERCVDRARHVEVQLVVDAFGQGVAFGVRDCTLQRRHQKVMEECPGPWATPERVSQLEGWALAFAKACGYRNAGTVEFLVDLDVGGGTPYFMEMNARLQVEHPVTELVYGVDLVRLQLEVAMGQPLAPAPTPRGAAIEVRLNAEDPDEGFAPSPGRLTRFSAPLGPGIRVDSGVVEGSEVPPDFDSNIAKLMAHGASRAEALARLRRALGETVVLVGDGATNKGLLAELLQDPEVCSGAIDTRWLDRRSGGKRPFAAEALAVAAVLGFREDGRRDLSNFYAAVARGVPQTMPDSGAREVRLRPGGGGGSAARVGVLCIGYGVYRVTLGGDVVVVQLGGNAPGHATVGARRFHLLAQADARAFVVELDGVSHRIARDPGGVVKAPAPAMVMELAVAVGDVVRAGQRLGVLEAMKMEMPLVSAQAGTVREVRVGVGSQVAAGQVIVSLDPLGDGSEPLAPPAGPSASETPGARAFLSAPDLFGELFDAEGALIVERLDRQDARAVADAVAAEARSIMLGYGLVSGRVERLLKLLDAESAFEELSRADDWEGLISVLHAFADVESLFSRDLEAPSTGGPRMSNEARFWDFARHLGTNPTVAPNFRPVLRAALAHYNANESSPPGALRHVIARLAVARTRQGPRAGLRHRVASGVLRLIMALHRGGAEIASADGLMAVLEQIPMVADAAWPFVADNAMQARYVLYHQPRYEERERDLTRRVSGLIGRIVEAPSHEREARVLELVETPHSVVRLLATETRPSVSPPRRLVAAEILFRRIYERLSGAEARWEANLPFIELKPAAAAKTAKSDERKGAEHTRVLAVVCTPGTLGDAIAPLQRALAAGPAIVEVLLHPEGEPELALSERALAMARALRGATRLTAVIADPAAAVVPQWTFGPGGEDAAELSHLRNLHPELAERLELWRYAEFELTRVQSHDRLVVFKARARANPRDERLFVIAEVRDVPEGEVLDEAPSALLAFEHAFHEAMRALREVQARREVRARYLWNRVTLHVRPVVMVSRTQVRRVALRLAPYADGLGLEQVVVRARHRERLDGPVTDIKIRFSRPSGHAVEFAQSALSEERIHPASPYELKLRAARAYGVTYPYEVVRQLVGPQPGPASRFEEYELDGDQAVPIDRPYGGNPSGVVFGLLRTPTAKVPEGLDRVLILSDPLHRMAALAGPECMRLIAALDLAEARGLCVEWLATSAGALIAMDSGTENLDWTARVLRRIIEFTRRGGAIHVIVDGVNVGAQSYFNAEATMLMHTRGVLIMTPRGSMVLTGKRALDASGCVSAEDERGIGGYERVMGQNGEAQLLARDLPHAFRLLSQYHDVATRVPGEAALRRRPTPDPVTRDVTCAPYTGEGGFATVGEIFSQNPERKRPFAMRSVMHALVDQDAPLLERFADMRHGETAITWDTHVGSHAVTLIGIESQPIARRGWVPGDGPEMWTGGTLFPGSSKKVARAIRSASGVRPVVVLANLSGFDGSPESMRRMQLEFGAEIGRAVVEFEGRIVFCVVARYHGGAYVVFSKALNENLVSLAVEGSFASVIGGAPAAAVVFPREVAGRTHDDPRVAEARRALEGAQQDQKPRLREQLARLSATVKAEKQAEFARMFDAVHSVARAAAVGSLDAVLPAAELRPRIVAALDLPLITPG